jgi:dihydroorotase
VIRKMKIIIKNGRLIDPESKLDGVSDILLEEEKIARVGQDLGASADTVIDAKGLLVLPGLVDMHVHLRQPGREDKETIASGSRAALKGGITSLLAMPNTTPAIDSAAQVKSLKKIIATDAKACVFICGTITKERQGEKISDISAMKKEGAIALSDDGSSVDDAKLMQQALKSAKENKILTICHCEDKALSGSGVVNLGFTSTRLGLRGISKESEYKRIGRDIELAQKTGVPLHIAHVSCKESLELIAQARKKGLPVTCETAPHYFSLSEEAVLDYDTNMKVNPPLRSKEDIAAIRDGLKAGVIDAIASDHAPHTESEKAIEFERAEFGSVGLETALAVGITVLIETNLLTWTELICKMSTNPAKILGLNKGTLRVGSDADLAIVDPRKEWLVEKASLISKSKNSAFLGRKLKGVVLYTICQGELVYQP